MTRHWRNDPDLWNTTEIARYLGVKVGTVSSYRIRGQMPPPDVTIGTRTHLWRAATIRKWAARRKQFGGLDDGPV